MKFHLRPAVASDMQAVHALIHELATYEKAAEELAQEIRAKLTAYFSR